MDSLDFMELASWLCGMYDVCYEDEELLSIFHNKYGIEPDNAIKLIKDLLPLCYVGYNTATRKHHKGFAVDGDWLVKQEIIQPREGS